MKTSDKIAKARKNLNLTQDQLAELLQVSRQTISKWELDISIPETNKLTKLSEVLEISIDYMLNEEKTDNQQIPMKKGHSGYEPNWEELYPILKQYQKEVDCQYYYDKFNKIFDDIENRYKYSQEDAMLVAKDMMAKAYFKRIEM